MKLILDASVALKWVLNEEGSLAALNLQAEFLAGDHDLIAPGIFAIEVGHALTKAKRRHLMPVGEAAELAARITLEGPELYPSLDLVPRAIELSSAWRLGVHDCVYVALAEQETVPLLTADERLANAVRHVVPILLLNELHP